jgi:photosystem II stability/assembly factor-like uncharacterized protein
MSASFQHAEDTSDKPPSPHQTEIDKFIRRLTCLLPLIVLCIAILFVGCSEDSKENIIGTGEVTLEPGWINLGLEGSRTYDLVLDWPYLYAAAGSDGLFRRRADTQSEWTLLGFENTAGNVFYRGPLTVVVLANGDILTGLGTGNDGTGLYRSEDNGATWEASDTGIADENAPNASTIYDLEANSAADQVVFAGGYGLYRSEDAGKTWTLVWGHPAGMAYSFRNITCCPEDPSLAMAGGTTSGFESFFIKSADGGANWQTSRIYCNPVTDSFVAAAFDPVDPNIAYAGMGMVGLVKTVDGGATWAPAGAVDERLTSIAHDPTTSGHLYFADWDYLYESTDGGETGIVLDCPNEGRISDLVYDPSRNALYLATASGVIRYIPE